MYNAANGFNCDRWESRDAAAAKPAGERTLEFSGSPWLRIEVSMKILSSVVFMLVIAAGASAQWMDHKWIGIPRTPDGKADLKARAPRAGDGKPDLAGLWRIDSGKYLTNLNWD